GQITISSTDTGLTSIGSGNPGYLARWNGANTLAQGLLMDNGTVAGINATSSNYTFNLQGSSGVSPLNIASSSGTSMFVVNQNGRVGIGSSSPMDLLTVFGGDISLSRTQYLRFRSETTGAQSAGVGGTTSNDLVLYSNGLVEGARLSSGGNLGIGTTTPLNALAVSRDWSTALSSGGYSGSQISARGATNPNLGLFVGYHTSGDYGVIQAADVGTGFKNLLLNPLGGNIGIGTTTPSGIMHISAASGAAQLYINGNDSNFAEGIILQRAGVEKFQVGLSASANNGITGSAQNDAIIRSTGNMLFSAAPLSPHMVITTTGNVGIGTSTASFLLDVQKPTGVSTTTAATRIAINNGFTGTNTAAVFQLANNDLPNSQSYNFSFGGTALVGQNTKQLTVQGGSSASVIQFNDAGGGNSVEILMGNNTAQGHGIYIAGLAGQVPNLLNVASSSGSAYFAVTPIGNVNVATLTASSLVMSDAGKNLSSVTLGSGLSLSGSTLSVTSSAGANAAWTIGNGLIYNATTTDLVGIGTITPTTTLFVQGKAGTNVLNIVSSTGSSMLAISQNGNVGIGNANPSASFEVKVGAATGAIQLTGGATGLSINNISYLNNFGGFLQLRDENGLQNVVLRSYADSFIKGGNLGIGTTSPSAVLFAQGTSSLPSANVLVLASSSGSNLMTVTSRGNVGIGIENPGALLQVSGQGTDIVTFGNGVDTNTSFNVQNRALFGYNQSRGAATVQGITGRGIDFNVNNSTFGSGQAMVITSGGLVGVGTTSPSATLFVQGIASSTINPFVVASSSGTSLFAVSPNGSTTIASLGTGCVGVVSGQLYTASCASGSVTGTGSVGFNAIWNGSGSLTTGKIMDNGVVAGINATSSNYTLNIQSNENINPLNISSSSGNSVFMVDKQGNIGVGTTTPTANLSVAGTLQTTGNATVGGNVVTALITGNAGTSKIDFLNNQLAFTGGTTMRFNASGLAIGGLPTNMLDVFGNAAIGAAYAGTTSPTNGLIVQGNVGIGTTSPVAKLDVYGNLNVGTSSTPALFVNTATGNVGIGTSTPNAKLSVMGSASFLTPTSTAAYFSPTSYANGGGLVLTVVNTVGSLQAWEAWSPSNGVLNQTFTGGNSSAINFNAGGNSSINFSTNGTTKLSLNTDFGQASGVGVTVNGGGTLDPFNVTSSSGASILRVTTGMNVGIGTTTPGRTLTVAGDIRATGSLYDSSNSAGTAGSFLMSTGSGYAWNSTSTLFGGNIYLNNNQLSLFGNSALNQNLTTTSSPTFAGLAVTNASTTNLTVSGNLHAGSILGLSTLSFTNASTTNLTSSGNAYLNALIASGPSTLTTASATALSLSNNFWVTGQSSLNNASSSALTVSGNTWLSGLSFTNASGTNQTLSGNFYVTGVSTLATTTVTRLTASGSTTISSLAAGLVRSDANGGLFNGPADISSETNLSVSATGLQLSGDAVALQAGYVIPLTASTTEWATARNIVNASSTLWDTAYSWGNHAAAGYLTSASAATTYVPFSYASSTFPSFTYASSTYATQASLLSYPTFAYGSSTYVNFSYASSVFATIANYPTYSYASGSFVTYPYASSSFATVWNLRQITISSTDTGITSIGSGNPGYLARWNGANTLAQGLLMDNGTVAGINATSSNYTFNLQGSSGVSPLNIASSSGTSMFVVNQNGNVGVGTTDPLAKLHVSGTGYFTSGATVNRGSYYITNVDGSSDAGIYTPGSTNDLYLTSGASNRIILSGGNVGIGTTTPQSKLEVGDGTDSLQITAAGDIVMNDANGSANLYGPNGGSLNLITGANQDLNLTLGSGSNRVYFSKDGTALEVNSATTDIVFDVNGNRTTTLRVENEWGGQSANLYVEGVSSLGTTSSASALLVQAAAAINPFQVASSSGASMFNVSANGSTTISSLGTGCVGVSSGQLYTTSCGGGSISGSGTIGFNAIWNGGTSLTTGKLIDNGSVLGVNATSTNYTFNLQGSSGVSPLNIASSTGASMFVVDQTGNVGIGTSNAYTILDIKTSNQAGLRLSGGANDSFTYSAIDLSNDTNTRDWYMAHKKSPANAFYFQYYNGVSYPTMWAAFPDGTSYIGIAPNGNPSTPDSTLSIFNENSGATRLSVTAGSGQSTTNLTEWRNNSSLPLTVVTSAGAVGVNTSSPIATLAVRGLAGATNPFIVTSSSGASLIMVGQNGNVGIGTTTPQAALGVVSNVASGNMFIVSSSSGQSYFTVAQHSSYASTSQVTVQGTVAVNNNFDQSANVVLKNSNTGTQSAAGYVVTAGDDFTNLGVFAAYSTTYDNPPGYERAGRVLLGHSIGSGGLSLIGGSDIRFNVSDTALAGEVMRLNTTGLVIGATTTTSRLNLVGTPSIDPFVISSTSGGTLLKVTNSGRLGIGTSSPIATLTVMGTSSAPTVSPLVVASSSGNTLFAIAPNGSTTISSLGAGLVRSTASGSLYTDATTYLQSSDLTNYMQFSYASSTFPSFTYASSSFATVWNLRAGSNVTITTSTPGQITISSTDTGITSIGSGSTGFVSRWNGANTLAQGLLMDNGTVAGINATSSSYTFNLQASANLNPLSISSSSGTSYLNILANGNVGIGTSAPTALLEVYGSSGEMQRITGVTNAYMTFRKGATIEGYLGYASSGVILNNALSDSMAIRAVNGLHLVGGSNDAAIGMTITSGGNIGINSTAPTVKLDVQGTGGVVLDAGNVGIGTNVLNSKLEVRSDTNGLVPMLTLRNNYATPGSATTRLGFGSYRDVDPTNMGASIDALNTTGTVNGNNAQGASLLFNTTADGSLGLVERMRILNTGNVGINTSTPGNTFVVGGSIDATGTYKINNTIRLLASANYTEIQDGSNTTKLHLGNATDPTNYYTNDTHFFRNANASVEYMRITNTGRVGIGTSSPIATFAVMGSTSAPSINPFVVASSSGRQLLVVNPSGNVGIGTSAPGFLLHVNGDAMFGANVPTYIPSAPLNLVNSAGGVMKTQMNLVNTGGGAGAGSAIDFYTYDLSGGTNPGLRMAAYDNNYSADFTLLMKNPGAAGNALIERLRVTNDGRLGLGTSSPIATLTVMGTSSAPTINPFVVASSTGTVLLSVANNGTTTISSLGTGCVGVSSGQLYTTSCGGGSLSGSGIIGFNAIWNGSASLTAGKLIDNGSVLGVNATSSSVTLNVQGNSGNVDPLNVASSSGLSVLRVTALGRVGIGTATPLGLLHLVGSVSTSGANAVAGIFASTTLNNTTASGFQYGGRYINTITGNASGTLIGALFRMVDNTTNTSTVAALRAEGYSGSNTAGVNVGLVALGKTFGVQAYTDGLAGGTSQPAAVFAELGHPSSGNALRLYSATATGATLLSIYHETSAATGTGLSIDMGNGTGSFNGKFVQFSRAGTSKFIVDSMGQVAVGTTSIGSMFDIASSTSSSNIDLFRVVSNVGATGNVKFRVDSDGDVYSDGTNNLGGGADLAENYPSFDLSLEAGEVVALATSTSSIISSESQDNQTVENISGVVRASINTPHVLGIVASKPAILMSSNTINSKPIALAGRVPVKVSLENGAIRIGDYLTISKEVPGAAAKAIYSGNVIGRALENYSSENSSGKVFVFIEVGYRSINSTIVLGGDSGQLSGNVSGTGLQASSSALIINQKGSGDILQLQAEGMNKVIFGNGGSMSIFASTTLPTTTLLSVINSTSSVFSINARGDLTIKGVLVIENDSFAGSIATNEDGMAEIIFSNHLGTGKPVIQLTPESENPVFAQVAEWKKDEQENYIGFKIKTFGINGSVVSAVVHYNVTGKQEGYKTQGQVLGVVLNPQGQPSLNSSGSIINNNGSDEVINSGSQEEENTNTESSPEATEGVNIQTPDINEGGSVGQSGTEEIPPAPASNIQTEPSAGESPASLPETSSGNSGTGE
ncbi:MAG: hypothetical protein JNK33_00195, partial [Candidatus Doudnabacteria bacterium]|nr:hypothetical protein [Candidatus Doudnabacteria bacterium]